MAGRRQLLAGLLAVGAALLPFRSRAELATDGQPAAKPADRIVILKRQRTLLLMRGNQVLRSFRVALGRNPYGAKTRQGDFRTPEGQYRVAGFNPQSYFYRAIA